MRSGAGAEDVYKPNVWFYPGLLFMVDAETKDPMDSFSSILLSETAQVCVCVELWLIIESQ